MSELSVIERVLAERSDKPFTATNEQKKAKSQFWTTFQSGGIIPPVSPDLTIAAQYAGDSRIRTWWSTEGFSQWFWNSNEFEERLDYLAQIALDQLEVMISSGRTSDSARISAIKMILEASKKIGQKTDDSEFADQKISKMDQGQLEEYINSRIKLIPSNI